MSGGPLEEIAERAERTVAELRSSAGWLARKLLFAGPELLALDTTPARIKVRVVSDIERMTRLLMLHPLWLRHIGRMLVQARRTRRGKPVRVLDVGAGRGGLLARIDAWARRHRVAVQLEGVDSDAVLMAAAQRSAEEEGLRARFLTADLRALPFETGGVDVVVSTFLLHRLPPGDVARVLAEIDRVAAVDFFLFDTRRALAAVPVLGALLRLLAFDAPSRYDAMASLRKGYTAEELDALLRSAGVANAHVRGVPPSWLLATRA